MKVLFMTTRTNQKLKKYRIILKVIRCFTKNGSYWLEDQAYQLFLRQNRLKPDPFMEAASPEWNVFTPVLKNLN
jgi:hypothetical protein